MIRDSALFKASPFHQLTKEQCLAEEQILAITRTALGRLSTQNALADGEFGRLILVQGAAGTGKTVLISHLFNRLSREMTPSGNTLTEDGESQERSVNAYVLIQHNEQRHVYNQVAKKLGLQKTVDQVVLKPASFINAFSETKVDESGKPIKGKRDLSKPKGRADIALIDEAHLLLTQGNQGYQGKNMLLDIMRRAKVTIAVFDPAQILQSAQQWDESDLEALLASSHGGTHLESEEVTLRGGERFVRSSIVLKQQMRIAAD